MNLLTLPAFLVPRILLGSLLVVVLAASGCSKEGRAASRLKKADAYLAAGDLDRAAIEYKNAIKADSNSAVAMTRLATVYLREGRYGSAAPYLKKAEELAPNDLENRLRCIDLFLAVGNNQEAAREALFILEKRPGDPEALQALAESAVSPELIKTANERLKALPSEIAGRAPALTAAGFMKLKERDVVKARELLEKAVSLDAKYAPAHTGLGLVHAAQNALPRADQAFQTAAELSPVHSLRWVQWAMFKVRIGDMAAGKKILEDLVAKAPYFLPASLRLADVAMAENRLDDAEKLIKKVVQREPYHLEAMVTDMRIALFRKDVDGARRKAEAALSVFPQAPNVMLEAAKVYAARNENSNALRLLNQAIAAIPNYGEAILLRARLQLLQDDAGPVVTALKPIVDLNPNNLEAGFLLADGYRKLGRPDEAIAIYQKLETFHPDNPAIAFLTGVTRRQQNQLPEARAALERALAKAPNDYATLDQLVEVDILQKRFAPALARVNAAIAGRPTAAELPVLLAKIRLAQGERASAEEALGKALSLDPKLALARNFLIKIYVESNEPDRAIALLKETLADTPADAGGWMVLAGQYDKTNDKTGAIDAYEKAIALEANHVVALNNLANHLLEAGNVDRAYDLAKRAREAAPNHPHVGDTFGWIMYSKGEYASSLPILQDSAKKLPDSPAVEYHLGMNYYMLGDEAAARRHLSNVLARNPDFEHKDEIANRLAILNMAGSGGGAEQLAMLERYANLYPKDPVVLPRLAAVYRANNDLDTARATLERALQGNPQSARLHVSLAEVLFEKGETAKAADLAAQARKLDSGNGDAVALLGRAAFRTKEYQRAFPLLQEAVERRPGDIALLREFAETALQVGRIREATAAADKAVTVAGSESDRTRRALLGAMESVAKAREAKATADKVLAAHADDLAALFVSALGEVDAKAAAGKLERILKQSPDFLPAKRRMALLLSESGSDDVRAMELATQARALFATDPELTRALGIINLRQGNASRSQGLLESVREQYPSDGVFWYQLGLARSKNGQTREGTTALNKALELGLSGSDAEQARKQIAANSPPREVKD